MLLPASGGNLWCSLACGKAASWAPGVWAGLALCVCRGVTLTHKFPSWPSRLLQLAGPTPHTTASFRVPQCVCGKCLATRGTDLGTVPCSCPPLRKRSHWEHPQGPGFQWPLSPGLGARASYPSRPFSAQEKGLNFS